METTYRVALFGFVGFERATLDAFFRLTARRALRYAHEAMPDRADLLLVDGDIPALARHTALPPERCVYIGAEAPPNALLRLPRPLNMMALLRQLDARLAAASPAPPPAPAPVSPYVDTVRDQLGGNANEDTTPDKGPITVPGAGNSMDDILVVDDSDIALRFMAEVLGRYGFDVHLARSGEEALRRVAEQHFEFVFMDVNMPGMNGHQTTKLIKNSRYTPGRKPPTVVMLTSRDAMADKLRGTLAGCDAYLTKPLKRDDLMKVVGDRLVVTNPESDTVQGSTRS